MSTGPTVRSDIQNWHFWIQWKSVLVCSISHHHLIVHLKCFILVLVFLIFISCPELAHTGGQDTNHINKPLFSKLKFFFAQYLFLNALIWSWKNQELYSVKKILVCYSEQGTSFIPFSKMSCVRLLWLNGKFCVEQRKLLILSSILSFTKMRNTECKPSHNA